MLPAQEFEMTRRCELSGKLPMSGNLRSHAENSKFRLKVSAHALKTVEHRGGLDAFLTKAKNDDLSDKCRKIKSDIAKAKAEATPAAA
jgi:large subunit ribosomal protein L28